MSFYNTKLSVMFTVFTNLMDRHARISHSSGGYPIMEADRCITPEYMQYLNNAPALPLSYSHEWWKFNKIAGTTPALAVVA